MKPSTAEQLHTPLSVALAGAPSERATPLAVFRLARKLWLEGKRINIGNIARDTGVSRGTLYRWVGNRDLLIGEILWSLCVPTLEHAIAETPFSGVEHIVGVHRRVMSDVLSFPPMQRFLKEDPEYALRILTTRASPLHDRVVQATADHLKKQMLRGDLVLAVPAENIAEIIIRTNESLMYSDLISGRPPEIEQACEINRMLLSAGRNNASD